VPHPWYLAEPIPASRTPVQVISHCQRVRLAQPCKPDLLQHGSAQMALLGCNFARFRAQRQKRSFKTPGRPFAEHAFATPGDNWPAASEDSEKK